MSAPAAVAEYNRLVTARASEAAHWVGWLAEAFRAAGVTFDGEPMATFLRPHLVERAAWDVLRARGRGLLELAVRVSERAFDGDARRLCDWLGIPAAHARWIAVPRREPDVVLSRLDAFATPAGPRFIEINSDAPAGFGYGDRMAEVFGRLPFLAELARSHRVGYEPSGPALVDAVRRTAAAAGAPASPRVAIVDWADVRTRADQEILRESFLRAGVPCVLADPREMEIAGGRLCAGREPIEVVYRRVVLSELVEKEAEAAAFLRAYEEGRVVFVNTFRCQLSEDKALLALLTDDGFADLLGADERRLVAATVPWTRRVADGRTTKDGRAIDLLPWAAAHRAELVLKPAHAYGGRSVLVGEETVPAEWERALQAALGFAWVVQERVPIPEELFPVVQGAALAFVPLKVNTNPFYVAGADVGAVTRASRSAVVNVSAGGGSVPTFVVD